MTKEKKDAERFLRPFAVYLQFLQFLAAVVFPAVFLALPVLFAVFPVFLAMV